MNNDTVFQMRLSKDLKEKAKKIAKRKDMTLAQMIRQMLRRAR